MGEAVRNYEECKRGLGMEFAEEVYAAIARIIEYPKAWTALSANTRRCLIGRFPYGIVFNIKAGTVRIIAVANLHKRPNYWKGRR